MAKGIFIQPTTEYLYYLTAKNNWSGYFNKWLNEFQKRKNIISIHHLTEMVLAQQTQNQKKTNL